MTESLGWLLAGRGRPREADEETASVHTHTGHLDSRCERGQCSAPTQDTEGEKWLRGASMMGLVGSVPDCQSPSLVPSPHPEHL